MTEFEDQRNQRNQQHNDHNDHNNRNNQGNPPDLDETIPTSLNNPSSSAASSSDSDVTMPMAAQGSAVNSAPGSDTDMTIPMPSSDPDMTAVSNLNTDMAPTHVAGFNESDTAATQMNARQQQASGFAGDNCSGQVWGDFELGKKIGQGGMGAVYLGRQISLDRPVAIKVLPPHLSQDESFRKRFELEAKAVAQITSPYIVQVYGAGEHGGQNYFAMEFVEGKDLGERLKDGLRPTYQESAGFMIQAVKGLTTAGEHHLVHRDIKPGNMMVTDKGELKIMDFGLVKLKNSDGGSTGGLTMAGAVMGTVNYFSPEQGRGEECDQTTDIYAIGVVFYQLLAGTLPFSGVDATSIIYQHIHAEPRPLCEINPNVPESYQAIVSKCLQKDRRKRYQTAGELLRDLELVIEGAKPQNAPMDPDNLATGGSSVTDMKGSSHRALILAVLVLLAAAGGYYYWDQNIKDKQSSDSHHGIPVVDTDPVTGVDPLAKAREMLGTGDLKNAEILIQRFLNTEPGNTDWLDLLRRLNALRAGEIIKQARSLIQNGALSEARDLLTQAQELGGDNEEIDNLLKKIRVSSGLEEKLDIVRSFLDGGNPEKAIEVLNNLKSDSVPAVKDLRSIASTMKNDLETAHNTLAKGDIDTARVSFQSSSTAYPNKAARNGLEALAPTLQLNRAIDDHQLDVAREQLKEMKLLIPGTPVIEVSERKIAVVEIIVRGRKAARSGDVATAEKSLQDISRIIPGTAQEKAFKAYVQEYTVLGQFRSAVRESQLKQAREHLDMLKKIAPDSEAHRIAQREFKDSKIEEADRLQKKASFEKEVAAQVQAIKALILLRDPDFSEVQSRISKLVLSAGDDRPELKELNLLIVQKKSQIGVRATLAAIDSAIIEGREQDLVTYVTDEKFVTILKSFIGKKDLVFRHSIEKFHMHEGVAQVTVLLTNKFDTFPQSDMEIEYNLHENDGVWQIQSHNLGQ